MAMEKRWEAIPPQTFTADGGTTAGGDAGQITLASTLGFKVKQHVFIHALFKPDLTNLEVKRVLNDTTLFVGPIGGIDARQDLTGYTVAAGATMEAPEQNRPSIPEKEFFRATFAEEPIVAFREILVDQFGNYYSPTNPLPIAFDGTVSIGEVAIVGNPFPIYDQASNTVTVPTFSTVYTYNSTSDNTRIEALEVTVSTPSLIQVVLNGVTVRQRRTSPMERSILIQFKEPRKIPNSQNLQVQVLVDRFIETSYDTFVSLEGFLEV